MSQVIDPKDLEHLIRFHQDSISAYAGFISPSGRYLEEQTVKVLEHYRAIISADPAGYREPQDKPLPTSMFRLTPPGPEEFSG